MPETLRSPQRPESGNLPGSQQPVMPRERASSADGAPRAERPDPLPEGRGVRSKGARDAVIVTVLLQLLLAAPAGPVVARGDSATAHGDTVVVLPGVAVERDRAAGEAHRRMPTASVTELEVGAAGRSLETLAELVGEAAGVRVQQYGGLGAFSTVSIRGAPPGQVAVYLDGAPLSAGAHTVVSLGDLPATAIGRIQVYRGGTPLEFGPAAPGGAINVVTDGAAGLRLGRVTRGAFGTWEARGSAGGRRRSLSGFVHAGHQRSRGDFTYPDDNGTPFNVDDDGLSTRANNAFAATSVIGNVAWRARPGWSVSGRADLFHKAQGVPGLGAVPAFDTHLAFTRALGRLDVSRAGLGPVPGIRIAGGLTRERTRFRDPGAELGLGRHDTDDHASGEDVSLELAWRDLPHGLALVTYGSTRAERSSPTDGSDGLPDPPASRRRAAGGGGSVQWRSRGEGILLHLAARGDRLVDRIRWIEAGGLARANDVHRTLVSPQAGVRVTLPRRIELRVNASEARRAPDFLELFGNQGSVLGNPALDPERARTADIGLAWSASSGRRVTLDLDVAHFETRAEDMVVYVRHSQSSVRAENVSRARIRGEELTLRIAGPAAVSLTGSATRLDARDEGPVPYWNGRRLPLRPQFQSYARLDWRRRLFRVTGDVHAIGEDFLDRANLQPVPDRLLVGASLSFSPRAGRLRFTVEGKNLGDDRVSDVGGFPLPGRALFASCELRLGAAPSTP